MEGCCLWSLKLQPVHSPTGPSNIIVNHATKIASVFRGTAIKYRTQDLRRLVVDSGDVGSNLFVRPALFPTETTGPRVHGLERWVLKVLNGGLLSAEQTTPLNPSITTNHIPEAARAPPAHHGSQPRVGLCRSIVKGERPAIPRQSDKRFK